MNRYDDIHLDDGRRHGGLVPTKQELYEESLLKRIESLTRERDEWRRRWHDTYDREERFRDERDELRRILDEAPHEATCAYWVIQRSKACDCWKSRVPDTQA